jgi:SAM-dependent methyltransferase
LNPKYLVETGYDRIAERYLATKGPEDARILDLLRELTRALPDGTPVLDLGCGAGVPLTRRLAERFDVTGVDISARQLELARRHVPNATFIKADQAEVAFAPASFDAVVAFHSIIHVPREEQPPLVGRIHDWLRPGGGFLATWATDAWEGDDPDWEGWGVPMWWSHYGPEQSTAMLRTAGLVIERAEEINSGDETWLWALARKPAR